MRGDPQNHHRESAEGYMAKTDTQPRISARDLAWLAETADGIRNEEVVLVLKKDGSGYELKEEREAEREGQEVVLRVYTEAVRRRELQPATITVKAEGGKAFRVDQTADALFWTESSIEKFLFPYYYAQRLLTEEEMARLRESFERANIVAFAHIPPSRATPVGRRGLETIDVIRKSGPTKRDEGGELSPTPLGQYLKSI
jgi:hypothetical protein